MNTQIWICDDIPQKLPDFINPYITRDIYCDGGMFYIFELDVYHSTFSRCKTPDNKAMDYLKHFGFKRPRKMYQGLRSEFFLNPTDVYPPKISSLSTAGLG
jgi:hypothetical protein